METFDYIIVGSGFFGSVLAERLANAMQKTVLVIEKRSHIGGNCYSEIDKETGIEFHTYGTHIFHTSNKKVMDYISQFCELNSYRHQVLAYHNNKLYQLPINLETINSFFGVCLRPFEVEKFLYEQIKSEYLENPKNLEEKAISQIGRPLYEAFIKGYTKKQWDKDPKDLPASIIKRLPFRTDYNESYFHNSTYQGIPKDGYSAIFRKLLDSERIKVLLNEDYFLIKNKFKARKKTIYTGPIDQYFDFSLGRLEWRSLDFKSTIKNVEDWQGTSVINYPSLEKTYTRIHEPKHLHPERSKSEKTLIIKEYPKTDIDNPYYPINSLKNNQMNQAYQELAKKDRNVIFGGRLGCYAYYDMDVTIAAALRCYEQIEKNSLGSKNAC